MNEQNQQLLAQLNDIHAPSRIDAFPLAWGWWAVAFALVLLILGSVIWWRRRRAFNAARRQAQSEVRSIDANDNDWPSQLNKVLKRTALAYFPASAMSGLYGQRWTQFMLQQLSTSQQTSMAGKLSQLQDMLYQPAKPDPSSFSTCQQAALNWLKKADFKRVARQYSTSSVNHV